MGFATGEPNDGAGLAGTATGDLFGFGDIRDAVREGGRLALGQPADELVLGLAGVGLAITAGTYATLGAAVPARVGLSPPIWVARCGRWWTGTSSRARWAVPRSLNRRWRSAPSAKWSRSNAPMGWFIWSATSAVCRLRPALGRHSKASRWPKAHVKCPAFAGLADAKGGKTRAILKLVGRGAIVLT
jgi:hypothetical protein